MKCALVIPAWKPEELFPSKTSQSQLNYWQPLGTLYVAAALKNAGHYVRFYNGAFMSHTKIMDALGVFEPEFVGLYSTTFGWPKASMTASAIKALDCRPFICVGGPYPIAMQADCLQDNNAIDAVITGEAEITIRLLVARLMRDESLEGLAGVVYRKQNQVMVNPPRALSEKLDNLPFPARELLNKKDHYLPPPATYRRTPVAVVLTSRGCDRHCIYCSQIDAKRESGIRGIRYRSVGNVIEEIELCLQQGYREIKFIDDSLAADYDRLMELCQQIQQRHLDFTWFASACVNQVDKPLLRAMKQAGCWAILFGAESGVQKNLNILRKGTTLIQIMLAVKMAKEVGLSVTTSFMLGIPGETYEDGLRTIDFAIKLNPDFVNFHALTAFPGTYLYQHLEDYGEVTTDLSDYTYQGAAFVPFSLTREKIQILRQLAFKRFYSRPAYLWSRIKKLRNWNDLVTAAIGLKSLMWICCSKSLFKRNISKAF